MPFKKGCYHIIAAKISIGMKMKANPPTRINLTQLHKDSHSKKEKKSGMKRRREGDYEIIAASNAVVIQMLRKVHNVHNTHMHV